MSPYFPLNHNDQPGNTSQKILENICLFSGLKCRSLHPPRLACREVTWHWGHVALSFFFEQDHKSIPHLLPTIKTALKFYCLFMMCNVAWFMWTQWVTLCNYGRLFFFFGGPCPLRDPLSHTGCQITYSSIFQLRRKHTHACTRTHPRACAHARTHIRLGHLGTVLPRQHRYVWTAGRPVQRQSRPEQSGNKLLITPSACPIAWCGSLMF